VSLGPDAIFFALFGSLCLLSALGVVLLRNAVKSALSLIACFFSLAALFLLQSAELLAALEVLVYAGAIMVLFVFVIMLVENRDEEAARSLLGSKLSLPIKVVGVSVVVLGAARLVGETVFGPSAELPEDFGSVNRIGNVCLRDYQFHFEITSVLLLVGIVGAVVISRRGRRTLEEASR
jgi:NADH-quinone oxidoreductase subunit J